MKGIVNILVGIYAIYKIASHFMNTPGENAYLFGFEVNQLVYAAFWGFIAFMCLADFMRTSKRSNNNRET